MKYFQKNKLVIGICIIFIVLCSAFITKIIFKPSITEIVKNNNIELTKIAEDIINNKSVGEHTFKNVWEISYHENSNTVEFFCNGSGLDSETYDEGFYYSPLNKPLGFQGENVEFIKYGKGFKYIGVGDNWQYTEKIMDKWYLYKAHF